MRTVAALAWLGAVRAVRPLAPVHAPLRPENFSGYGNGGHDDYQVCVG